jgi:hypothetical protein
VLRDSWFLRIRKGPIIISAVGAAHGVIRFNASRHHRSVRGLLDKHMRFPGRVDQRVPGGVSRYTAVHSLAAGA